MDGAPPYDVTQFALCKYASMVLVVLLIVVLTRQRQRLFSIFSRAQVRLLFAAVGMSFLLRFGWPELAVFHENGHGYRYIGMAIAPESDLHAYGSGYAAFFSLFYKRSNTLLKAAC